MKLAKLAATISLVLFTGHCTKNKPSAGARMPKSAITESCSDLDQQAAHMRCNGNNLEYCSSFSKFKWTEAQQCDAAKTCFVAPDGKGGGCR